LSGQFNNELFEKSYGFVDELRSQEVQQLQHDISQERDPEQLERLKRALGILTQQNVAKQRQQQRQKLKSQWKKQEAQKVALGRKPYYLKKSMEHQLEMVEKFKHLKESNKLETFMQKRVAKNAKKDHKFVPWQRRSGNSIEFPRD